MTKIVVDTEKLNEYGNKIQNQVATFDSITSKMDEVLLSLSEGWDGVDKDSFLANASEYLNNVKTIETALSECGTLVNDCAKKYQERINRFYED